MRYPQVLSHFLLILITFSLIFHPQPQILATSIQSVDSEENFNILVENEYHSSYDNILELLEELEEGDLEERCSLEELERLNCYIASLARQGMLPNESEEASTLENDIKEFLTVESNPYGYSYSLYGTGGYSMIPAIFYGQGDVVLCKSLWKKTKHFVKKHKKAIIIGVAIVVAVVVVGVVVAAVASAASVAANASEPHKERLSQAKAREPCSIDTPVAKTLSGEEIASFKEFIAEERFFETGSGFSLEENGRVLGQALAYQSLDNTLQPYFNHGMQGGENLSGLNSYPVAAGYEAKSKFFSSNSTYPIENPRVDFKETVYQLRGERSLELHRNNQAILDLGRIIEHNPNNHKAYLDRAIAYREIGDHERSLADYKQYTEKKPAPLIHVIDFSYAFAKAFPKGIRESGKQLGTFASDLIIHPINTAGEVSKAFALLANLVYSQEWASIAETLTPEVCELVTEWSTLSPEEQGERSGYIFGKYETDIVAPGAIGKLLSKGTKVLKEVAAVRSPLVMAERTLAFETGQSASKLHIPTVVTYDTSEKIISNIDKFAEAGRAMDRASLTKAGRGLMKHGYRDGSIHPKPIGTIAEINEHGQQVLESILNHPERKIIIDKNKRHGLVIDIETPNLGGARFSIDGETFIGFLEPRN